MRILKRKLVSVETISKSFQLFGRPEDILKAEVRTGEWLRTLVKNKISDPNSVIP
jgi:hypothetical protein